MHPLVLAAVVLYVLFLVFYVVWSLFLLYHLFRFAPRRGAALVGSGVFFGVTLVLLLVSAAYVARVDWSAPLDFPRGGF